MPDPIDPHHLRDPFRSLSRSGEPLLHMKLATVPKRRLALGREAAVLRTLRHPNAVELIEFREESLVTSDLRPLRTPLEHLRHWLTPRRAS